MTAFARSLDPGRARRRVLVTGAAGFVGGEMARFLHAAGWTVVGVDRRMCRGATFEFRCLDAADPALLREISTGAFHAVVHQAGISNTMEPDQDLLTAENVTRPVALATRCAEGGTTFVYASSFSVYGSTARSATSEDDLGRTSGPLNGYARSKRLLDARMSELELPMKWLGLRYTNVFGPAEPLAGRQPSIISKFLESAAREEVIDMFSDAWTGARDYVEVDRLGALVHDYLCCPDPPASGVYNAGSGIAVGFRELFAWIEEFAGAPIRVREVDNPVKGRYQYWTQADNSAISRHLPVMSGVTKEDVKSYARLCWDVRRRSYLRGRPHSDPRT